MFRQITQTNTTLKEKEEKRFDEFFIRFSRNGTTLTFSELLMFALDRNIIHNKISFSLLHTFFESAIDQSDASKQQLQQQQSSVFGQQDRGLSRHQFNFLLSQLSFYLYHEDRNHLDRLLSEILAEKTTITKDSSIEIVRNLIYDDLNKKILSESVITAVCIYEQEIRNCYTIYMHENLLKGYIMLRWYEIAIQNKKMNTSSLIRFARDADIIPNLLSIEQFEEILVKMIPPANNREHEFYQKGVLVTIYDRDSLDTMEGDPLISFHEFQLLLSRIAIELGQKEDHQNTQKKETEKYIHRFFSELMFFRKNEDVGVVNLPNLNRKLIKNLTKYQQLVMVQSDEEDILSEKEEEDLSNPVQKLAEEQHKVLFQDPINTLDLPIEQILKQLEKELPPLPPLPEITSEKAKMEKVIEIGDPLPQPPPDKNKPKANKKPKQKARRKAGEPEPKDYPYDQPPQEKVKEKTSEQQIQEYAQTLNFQQKLLSHVDRGTMSDIQVIPVIIPEVLYPPNPPPHVRTCIEAAINAHNEGNFLFAIQSYENASQLWDFKNDGIELYFEYAKASVYESAGRDDLALKHFLNAKQIGNKLPTNNPDRALAYCGLGLIFYNTEEYELGLRSYLKAREFREQMLGIEQVDTATVFNNLGCCMFMLDRNKEAYAYFKLAHAILETNLGQFHTRTLTAGRNILKSNKNYYENNPDYKRFWVTHVKDPYGGAGKKKKKKKGKK